MTAFAHRKGAGSEVLAFTVRPDLWPPGTSVYHRDSCQPALAHHDSREWALWSARRAQAAGLDVPGVAEALVLADQLQVWTINLDSWVACPEPLP